MKFESSLKPKFSKKELEKLKQKQKSGYLEETASLFLPLDTSQLQKIDQVIKECKKFKPEYLIVIGIGGSNLGTIAIQEAILGKNYNLLTKKVKVLYADTTDPKSMQDLLKLTKNKRVVLNVISKSGSTTETIANFEVLMQIPKKKVVVTSDENSKLHKFAVANKYLFLEIPKNVGGRYSVFSPVGLFPLGLLNINIKNLLLGAKSMLKLSTTNQGVISAGILYKQKRQIHDTFLFANNLESIGKWYRQLLAESIGKEENAKGKKVYAGITPTVSIGSTDLHSMAQLYLGGPYDKITTFISIEKHPKVKIPNKPEFNALVENIQGRTFQEILEAILKGVQLAFKKSKRPFMQITLKEVNEFEIGALLQMKMIEVMMLGKLLGLNPFDQPAVEKYKVETKRILGGKK